MKKKGGVLKFCRCGYCRTQGAYHAKIARRRFRHIGKQAVQRGEDPPRKIYLGYLD